MKPKKEKKKGFELDVDYFVVGREIVFDLEGLDFTFEKFYIQLKEDGVRIFVKDEDPMNLINLLDSVELKMDPDRERILNSDSVSFTLKLKDEIFSSLKRQIAELTEIKDMFQTEMMGQYPLKYFRNYELVQYETTTTTRQY